jgi:hypothetical protein
MPADILTQINTYQPVLFLLIAIFISSLISLKVGLCVAIIELIVGAIFGNLGLLYTTNWITILALHFQQHLLQLSTHTNENINFRSKLDKIVLSSHSLSKF